MDKNFEIKTEVKQLPKNFTLGDCAKQGLCEVGTLLVGEKNKYLIGDATPFMQPSDSDGDIGWDWEDKEVILYAVKLSI